MFFRKKPLILPHFVISKEENRTLNSILFQTVSKGQNRNLRYIIDRMT